MVKELGFTQSVSDPSFFFKRSRTGKLMTIFLFVDDFQAGTDPADRNEWNECLQKLREEFNIKYMGEPSWLLGMRISRDRKQRIIALDQELYIVKALEKYGLTNSKPFATPAEVKRNADKKDVAEEEALHRSDHALYMEKVGTAIYASISTRLDVAHAVHECAKSMQRPTRSDMKAIDRLLRYLGGTRTLGLTFGNRNMNMNQGNTNASVSLCAYSDADWGNSLDRKSLTGWVAKLNGDPISWCCKKQSIVAQSTCEAELYAEAAAINEIQWVQDFIRELGLTMMGLNSLHVKEDTGVTVYVDNQSTIKVSKNGIKSSERTKHVDIKYHMVTQAINEKKVSLHWVATSEQQADLFTKSLSESAFVRLRDMLMGEIPLLIQARPSSA